MKNKLLKNWTFWLGLTLFVLVAVFTWQYDVRQHFRHFARNDLRVWLDARPVLAPAIFMTVYIVAVIAFLPGSVLTLIGGAVFGLLWGFVFTSIASTAAAGCSFLIARYLGADWLERTAGERLKKVQAGIERDGWKFIVVTRMIPFFPYNLLNYLFGLTRINFWTYLVLTWACMIPGTFAYVYAGYAIGVTFSADSSGFMRHYMLISSAAGVLLLVTLLPRWYNVTLMENETEHET